jgi:dihydrofolate reductase
VGRLVYSAIASLDGYVADREGRWDWSIPDDDVHAAVNDLTRQAAVHLYGRRTYEVLLAWETIPTGPDQPAAINEFAEIWRAADKVVYSATLPEVASARTRLERTFEPDAVAALKAATDGDLTIGGPDLAASAFRAGLVDDLHLFLSPVLVGGGTPALPDEVRADLELRAQRHFTNGVVHLHHAVLPRR